MRRKLAVSIGLAALIIIAWRLTGIDELLIGLLVAVLQWLLPTGESQPRPVRRYTDEIERFWDDEADRRRESDVDVDKTPSRWHRESATGWARDNLPIDGTSTQLVRKYVERPIRLLLVGDAGVGKTAFCVQLVRALANQPSEGPLPVLLPLSTWNRAEDLDTWIVEQLHTMHGIGRTQGRDLVKGRKLLPILDGLDEGRNSTTSLADDIAKLKASKLIGDKPFVVTCRADLFDSAGIDHLLNRDATLRIKPLDIDEIVQVLEDAFDGRPGWNRVIAELRAHRDGVLAQVLNTRLMLYLLTRVFTDAGPAPSELLSDNLHTVDAVRTYLLDHYLDMAITDGRFAHHKRNRHWLGYLAKSLAGRTDGSISWWRFFEVLRGSVAFVAVRVAVGALITSLLCLVLFGLFGHPVAGLLYGALLGGGGGALMRVPPAPAPKALPQALRVENGPWPSISAGIVAGFGGAVANGFLFRDPLLGAAVGLAIGLIIGVGRELLTHPGTRDKALSPRESLRNDRLAVLRGFVLGGVTIGLVGAALGLLGRANRIGLAFPVTSRLDEALVIGGVAALCGAFTLAMIIQATSAWGRFLLTKIMLALNGDVPWYLMGFLEEAERAGILRRLGPQYEFRSELFLTHLRHPHAAGAAKQVQR